MQGTRKIWWLTAGLALVLSACGQHAKKVPTVYDYMHDIDQAKAMKELGRKDPATYINDPALVNAEKAISLLYLNWAKGKEVMKCFGGVSMKDAATANTDHACLDAKGFKR